MTANNWGGLPRFFPRGDKILVGQLGATFDRGPYWPNCTTQGNVSTIILGFGQRPPNKVEGLDSFGSGAQKQATFLRFSSIFANLATHLSQ